eukprot:1123687_1
MEQFIKFRLQADTLSLDEYRCFICNVLNESNLQEFSSMIFKHVHQKWKKQTEEQPSNGLQMHHINHEISNIVSQRQMNETETDSEDDATNDKSPQPEPTQTNIHHQTDVVVQEIASYLPFKSYSNFQSCCRSIFYAANTPSTLYELDGNMNFADCINTENTYHVKAFMKRFERVQRLTITDDHEQYIRLVPFRNVKYLELYFPRAIEPYVSDNLFINNWNAIRILNFAGNLNHALELIKRCPNLSTLVVDEIEDEQNQLAELVGSRCNLQCLVLRCEAIVDTRVMLKKICNSLRSFSARLSLHNTDGMAFHNLVELYLIYPTPQGITSMLQATKNLKRLTLFMHPQRSSAGFASCFRKILELRTLEYFCFRCGRELLLQYTRLVETSFHQKRDTLKLKLIVCTGIDEPTSDDIHGATLRILNTLYTWCTRDFMLIVRLHSYDYKELTALDRWLNDLSNRFSVHVDKTIKSRPKLIISNKGSAFNGYEERLISSW